MRARSWGMAGILALSFAISNCQIAFAEDAPEVVPPECTEVSEIQPGQQVTNMCLGYASRAMTTEVNKAVDAYAVKLKTLYVGEPDELKLFLESLSASQTAFDAYLEAQCNNEGYMAHGGTLESQLYGECAIRLMKARLDELKMLQEGLGN